MKTATYLPQLLTVAVLSTIAAAKPDQTPLDLQSIATALKWQKFAIQKPALIVKQEPLAAEAPDRGHPACALQSRAPQQVEQNGFRLVVEMVRQRDGFGAALHEGCAARCTRLCAWTAG